MSAPGPAASTDDLVAWVLGTGHLALLDADARLIGEHAAPGYQPKPGDEQHRKFGDARDASGLPCNVAALAQVQSVWPWLLRAAPTLSGGEPPTYHRILRRTLAATHLARLSALRPPGRPPSREAATLYKVTNGFSELLALLLMERAIDADAAPGPERELDEWLAQRSFLIGEHQVCAGARAQIRALWRALRAEGRASETSEWSAAWWPAALDATIELAALAASAAGAARAFALGGRLAELDRGEPPLCWQLFDARQVPRWCQTLRLVPDAGAVHPTLLFPASAVPTSLRSFLEALPDAGASEAPLGATDALLLAHTSPVAARLMAALDRPGAALTLHAFAGAVHD